MFEDCLHCYGYKAMHSLPPPPTATSGQSGKMGHYVKDSLKTEKNSGPNYPDGGQLEHNGGQKVSLELCLAGAQVSNGKWI